MSDCLGEKAHSQLIYASQNADGNKKQKQEFNLGLERICNFMKLHKVAHNLKATLTSLQVRITMLLLGSVDTGLLFAVLTATALSVGY